MSEANVNAFLETEKLGTLMRKYSVPCVISLLVAALYNIVDQIFIANASYLGSYGNAANTVVFPLTVVALAVAVMIGDGCCAYVSICLGSRNRENAHRSIGSAVTLCVAASLVLTLLYLLLADPILTAFGGRVSQETFALSREYFFYITLGIPFYMFGQAMNPIIRSDGSPAFAMASTLAGAAVATVLGQVLTAALAVWYLCRMKAVQLEKRSFVPCRKVVRKFIPLGVCSFLSQISLVAAMAAINNMIRKYGALDVVFGQEQYAQIPMAVVGIVMKFFQIVISIVVGMAAGCIPIVGYNIGAGRADRAKHLFTYLLTAEACVGMAALLIAELLPGGLIQLFGAGNESVYYTQFAKKAFRVYLCMLPLACVNKAAFIYLQSLGKALLSTVLSMVREVVFGVGFALLLPVLFGLDGVLYSMPVSDVLTFLISVAAIVSTYRSLSAQEGGPHV